LRVVRDVQRRGSHEEVLMRVGSILLTIALLVLPGARLARADGWWEGCKNNEESGDPGGCNSDGDESTACSTGSSDAASVGGGLALVALVTYGIGRRRKK
jgi:MYXO-CTERM domain-containing protein